MKGGGGGRLPVVMMYICVCTFFQGTDATVGDSFAPLGPPLLPWENRLGRGHIHRQTFRLLDRIGPVGQFGEYYLCKPLSFM